MQQIPCYTDPYTRKKSEFYHNAPVGDYPQYFYRLREQFITLISLCSYRKGIEGSWTWEYELLTLMSSKFTYGMVRMLDEIDGYSNYAYHDLIEKEKSISVSLIDAQNDFKKMKEPKFLRNINHASRFEA